MLKTTEGTASEDIDRKIHDTGIELNALLYELKGQIDEIHDH